MNRFKEGTLAYIYEEDAIKENNNIQTIQLHDDTTTKPTMVRRLASNKV